MSSPEEAVRVTARFPSLAGQAAIITGASRGIGIGIAEFLGRQGMKMTLCARSEEAGLAVTRRLQEAGLDCQWITADLATPEGATAVFDAAVGKYGRQHLLVNNAAILWSRTILETDEEVYRKTFEANCRMFYGLSHLAARHMVEHGGGGCIVNISSVGGLRSHRHHYGYDGSKGAMDAMTRSMALDLAPHRITVNSVAPGATLANPEREGYAERAARRSPHVPLQRQATREEVGALVGFLASDAGGYITGQVLYIDGGLTAQLSPPGIFV